MACIDRAVADAPRFRARHRFASRLALATNAPLKTFCAPCRSESQLHGHGEYATVPISILSHIAHNCGPPGLVALLPFACARITATKMRMCSLLVGNASHERLKCPWGHSHADRLAVFEDVLEFCLPIVHVGPVTTITRATAKVSIVLGHSLKTYAQKIFGCLVTAELALLMAVSRRRSDLEQ